MGYGRKKKPLAHCHCHGMFKAEGTPVAVVKGWNGGEEIEELTIVVESASREVVRERSSPHFGNFDKRPPQNCLNFL